MSEPSTNAERTVAAYSALGRARTLIKNLTLELGAARAALDSMEGRHGLIFGQFWAGTLYGMQRVLWEMSKHVFRLRREVSEHGPAEKEKDT